MTILDTWDIDPLEVLALPVPPSVWDELRALVGRRPRSGPLDWTTLTGAICELQASGRLTEDDIDLFKWYLPEWSGTLEQLLRKVAKAPAGFIPKDSTPPF